MRTGLHLLGALATLAALVCPAAAQLGYERPGPAYLVFTERPADPSICAARCERDNRCQAWSFSYPLTKSVVATCMLMKRILPRVKDDCCVSGVRGAGVIEPQHGSVEFSIDRFGGDFRNVNVVTDPAGASCAAACKADNRCRAWTYARPGYVDVGARCYLKARITRPRHKPCCISGVVR